MIFSQQQFMEKVVELKTKRDLAGLEEFLGRELARLEEAFEIGSGCPSCNTGEKLAKDAEEFNRARTDGLIMAATELTDLQRGKRDYDGCFDTYLRLYGYIDEGGLANSELHLRTLVNEAYTRIEAGQIDAAAAALDKAEAIATAHAESGMKQDLSTLGRLYDARLTVLSLQGKNDDAAAVNEAIEELFAISAENKELQASLMLNHASTLAQIGDTGDALRVVDNFLLSKDEEAETAAGSYPEGTYYQALNLKAMVYYRDGKHLLAAKAFEDLAFAAQAAGDLKGSVPSLFQNASQMYKLAGEENNSRRCEALAKRAAM